MRSSTGDILDENPELSCLRSQYVSYGGVEIFSGPVRTVSCRGDNSRLRELLGSPGNGAVVVADGGASLEVALVGDRMVQRALDHGWVGLIIEGAVRDVAEIAQRPIGVVALGTTPRRSPKYDSGAIDVPISVGGVVVSSGDFVWADADGVVIAAAAKLPGLRKC